MSKVERQLGQMLVDKRLLTKDALETHLAQAESSNVPLAQILVAEGTEFSVTVRKGDVETLKEAGSKGLGLRVFVGKRTASWLPAKAQTRLSRPGLAVSPWAKRRGLWRNKMRPGSSADTTAMTKGVELETWRQRVNKFAPVALTALPKMPTMAL